MAANDTSTAARVARLGMNLIQPQQGLHALQQAMACSLLGCPVTAAVPFVWQTFLQRLQRGVGDIPHFFSAVASEHCPTPAHGSEAGRGNSTPGAADASEIHDAIQAKV